MDHPVSSLHLKQLDGVRGLAASFVVLHHAYYQTFGFITQTNPPGWWLPALAWLDYGHYAVDLFIVLSGFCLTIPVIRSGALKGGALGFLRNRSWRIIPPYLAGLLLGLFLQLTLIGQSTSTQWDIALGWTRNDLLRCLLLCPELAHYAINYPLWSVGVEFKIYLFFPAFLACWARFGLIFSTLVWSFAALCLAGKLRSTPLDSLTVWYLPLFLMGVCAAVVALSDDLRSQKARRVPWGWLFVVGSIAIVAFGYAAGFARIFRHFWLVDQVVGAVAACGLVSIVSQPGRLARWLQAYPLKNLGTIAFSLYLVHAPLLQLIDQYVLFPFDLSPLIRFAALASGGYLLILGFAALFYLIAERPFHRIAKG